MPHHYCYIHRTPIKRLIRAPQICRPGFQAAALRQRHTSAKTREKGQPTPSKSLVVLEEPASDDKNADQHCLRVCKPDEPLICCFCVKYRRFCRSWSVVGVSLPLVWPGDVYPPHVRSPSNSYYAKSHRRSTKFRNGGRHCPRAACLCIPFTLSAPLFLSSLHHGCQVLGLKGTDSYSGD